MNICDILGKWLKGEAIDISLLDNADLANDLIITAKNNKLAIILNRAVNNFYDGHEIISEENKKVNNYNIRLVYLVKKINDALNIGGIKHYFYKGPIQQKLLYGDYFAKPSLDVDFIVDYQDFDRAGEILKESGFTLGPGCEKLWWKFFLGEQHYFIKELLPLSADLHHRMQQPGCPAPKKIKRMLDNNAKVNLGSTEVDSFNLPMVAIIATINMLKAVYHRTPIGSHALDLAIALNKMSVEELVLLRNEAKIQGLNNSIKFCSRIISKLFKIEDKYFAGDFALPYKDDEIYSIMIEANYTNTTFPKRREVLFLLCDNKILDVPKEFFRWSFSEFSQSVAH